jgi:type IV secretory pathway VirB2 component (pilin)
MQKDWAFRRWILGVGMAVAILLPSQGSASIEDGCGMGFSATGSGECTPDAGGSSSSGSSSSGGGWPFGGGGGSPVASSSGSYGGGPIADVLCQVANWFRGSIGQGIATLAIITLGIGALFGKVSHGMALTVMVGIATIFGAQNIVTELTGMRAVCYSSVGSMFGFP